MVDQVGNAIPAPSVNKGGIYVTDDELLYSTVGYTQKGVTLKPGQGLLVLGTALARETTTKKYVKFVSGGLNGTGEAVGILRNSVETGPAGTLTTYLANIVIAGILNLSKVSIANGGTTAIVTAFTGSRTSSVLGTFQF